MSIVEIRTNDGVLLIARPGRLPAAVMRAGDRQSLQARLRRLPADVRALDHVRRMWRSLGMSISATTLDDDELARALSRRISSGLAEAVFLRDGLSVGMAKVDMPAPSPVVHVQLPGMTVLIAGKGQLPGEFQGQSNPAQAAQILRQIQHASPQAKTIDSHAYRLPGATTNIAKAAPLRQHIAHQLERGSYDAVVLTNPGTIAQAAARPEAPKPVSAMTSEERIGEALRLSLPYALKAGGEELKKTLEDMLDPRNIGLMIAMAAGVALANLNPISAVVVDGALLVLAWWNGGSEAIAGITDFAMATLDARDATDEAELDKAAQAYGAALGKMGPKLLAALFSKLKKSKGAAGDKGGTGESKSSMVGSSKPSRTPPENVAPSHLPLSAKDKLKEVLRTSKGKKPPPKDYLSKEYIADHLAEFQNGSVYKIIKGPPRAGSFGKDDVFVLPKAQVDAAIAKANGNPRKLEKLLGMEKGYLGDSPYLLEFKNPKNVRMATGNEENAWGKYWRPGGYTSGGVKEAVIDGKIDSSDFHATPILKGN